MYSVEFKRIFTYPFSISCVVFGFEGDQINVLTIKHIKESDSTNWSIPGGLVYPDEDLDCAATRILFDLTKLKGVELHQAETFGKPNRHPEGRVITTSYFALIRIEDFELQPSTEVKEVKWMPIRDVQHLAFDHKEILLSTFNLLKKKLAYEPICFDLLPEKFTLNQLQQIYEYVHDLEMDKANFRKKIKSIPLIALADKQENVRHRPAKLFSFDSEKYQEMIQKEGYQFKL